MNFCRIFVKAFCLAIVVDAKTYVIIDDRLENCAPPGKDLKLYDYSNFHMIPENDTHTFVNGSIKVMKEIASPWFIHAHTEHYERGQWLLQAYTKDYKDFCTEMHNPSSPSYYVTKDYSACPIAAGYEFKFDMVPIEFSPAVLAAIPSHYMGQWRLFIDGKFDVDGKDMHECKIGFADIFVETVPKL